MLTDITLEMKGNLICISNVRAFLFLEIASKELYYIYCMLQMDAMYKNIQTSTYTISIAFAGITIAQVT